MSKYFSVWFIVISPLKKMHYKVTNTGEKIIISAGNKDEG